MPSIRSTRLAFFLGVAVMAFANLGMEAYWKIGDYTLNAQQSQRHYQTMQTLAGMYHWVSPRHPKEAAELTAEGVLKHPEVGKAAPVQFCPVCYAKSCDVRDRHITDDCGAPATYWDCVPAMPDGGWEVWAFIASVAAACGAWFWFRRGG